MFVQQRLRCQAVLRAGRQRMITSCQGSLIVVQIRKYSGNWWPILCSTGVASLPLYDSVEDLANQFSTFFIQKIETLRNHLMSVQPRNFKPVPWYNRPGSTSNVGRVYSPEFPPATEQVVSDVVSASPAKSCPLDPVPTWLLQNMRNLILCIIAIVNK